LLVEIQRATGTGYYFFRLFGFFNRIAAAGFLDKLNA
jgi:hypothetical protein